MYNYIATHRTHPVISQYNMYRSTYQDSTLSQHEVNSPDALPQSWHFSHVPSFECVGSLNHD